VKKAAAPKMEIRMLRMCLAATERLLSIDHLMVYILVERE